MPARLYLVSSEEAKGPTRSTSFRKTSESTDTDLDFGFSGISGNSWLGSPASRKCPCPAEIST